MPSLLVGKLGLYVGAILLALLCLWGISRNWNCRKSPEPRTHTDTYVVTNVTAANRFTVRDGRRTREVTIQYIVDSGLPDGLKMTSSLLPIDKECHITVHGRRRILGSAQDSLPQQDEQTEVTAEAPEARGPIIGVVRSQSGADVGWELIQAGWASASIDAPASYKTAEKAAKKSRLGIWR